MSPIISGKKSTFTLVLNQCFIFATWLMAAGQTHWFPFAPLLEQKKVWSTFRINVETCLFLWHDLLSHELGVLQCDPILT